MAQILYYKYGKSTFKKSIPITTMLMKTEKIKNFQKTVSVLHYTIEKNQSVL